MAVNSPPKPTKPRNVYRITQVENLPQLKLEDEEEMDRLEKEAEARGADPKELVQIRTSFAGKMLTQDHDRIREAQRREDMAKNKMDNSSEGSVSLPVTGGSGEAKG